MKTKSVIAKKVIVVALVTMLSACSDQEQQSRLQAGEEIVNNNCKVCHAAAINGAPIIGNQKMWAPRLPKGREALVKNAVSGVGLMPAKGGKTHLSDEQIDLAVGYFLSQLEKQ